MLKQILLVVLLARVLTGPAESRGAPKLVVAIVVDQLRYDYLERFQDQFTENGFRLLMDRGAFMTFARYDYFPTITAPGHASIFSGAPPSIHGIVGNDFFDRKTGKSVYCVADPSVIGIGTKTNRSQMSPRNFSGGNFADQFRVHFRSKVVGLSMKDRSAVLPAGKKPAGAYWWEPETGDFVSSSYYLTELPAWVQEFNARKRIKDFDGKAWTRLLDERVYHNPDKGPGEGSLFGETNALFNHVLTFKTNTFEEIMPTPFSNQLLGEFAYAAIEGEQLGLGPEPDLLCISFSGNDACGHKFGPYSQEVQDMTLRLDRQLAAFFGYLDRHFGMSNVIVMLTADHGVAPIPEFSKENGLESRRFDPKEYATNITTMLTREFGQGKYLLTTNLLNGHLFLDHATLREKHLASADVLSVIRDNAIDSGLFQVCYSREQLLEGRAPGWIGRLAFNGYYPERGGDLVLIPKPLMVAGSEKTGTSHGTPYSYDTHVPVLFYGEPFKAGRYADEFYITDVSPTLATALKMGQPADAIGRPFVKALQEPPPPAPPHSDRHEF